MKTITISQFTKFSVIRNKLIKKYEIYNSFKIQIQNREVRDYYKVLDVGSTEFDLIYVDDEIDKIEIMLSQQNFQRKYWINTRNTWNYEASKIARTLGMDVKNLYLASEIIHSNKTCGDIL
jgi:hypothetical protein